MAILLKNVNPTILGNQDTTVEIVNNLAVGGSTVSSGIRFQTYGNGKFQSSSGQLTLDLQSGSGKMYSFVVNPAWGTDKFFIYDKTNDVARLVVDSSGNVGIGTLSPAVKFEVSSDANSEMRLSTTSDGFLTMGQFTNGAYIGTSSSDATDGLLRFGTGGTERVRIDLSGKVRIGTGGSSPRADLDLSSDGSILLIGGGSLGGYLRFGVNNNGNAIEYASNELSYRTNQIYGHRFYVNGVERLRLGGSGNSDQNNKVEAFGRVKLWPDNATGTSSGIWFTGNGGGLTTFLGKADVTDAANFGFYYNGWRLLVNQGEVVIGDAGNGTALRMRSGGRVFMMDSIADDSANGLHWHPDDYSNYGLFREAGPWTYPFPNFRLAAHTGLKIGAYFGHGGVRFYNNSSMGTEILSIGNGDNRLRAHYGATIKGGLYAYTIGQDFAPVRFFSPDMSGPTGILYSKDGWVGVTTENGSNGFFVTPGRVSININSSPRFIIDSTGCIGIGTDPDGVARLNLTAVANSGPVISYGNTAPNRPIHTNYYGGWSGIGMDQFSAGVRIAGDPAVVVSDTGYYSGQVPNHANWVSLLKVMGSGSVGIGTSSPGAYRLSVLSTNHHLPARFQYGGNEPVHMLSLGSEAGICDAGYASAFVIKGGGNQPALIRAGSATRVYIDGGGNVGVGTVSPTEKLQVVGTIHSTTGGIKFPDGSTQTTAASVIGNPVGTIITFATAAAPSGFLLCDGTAVSRTTYSALFALVGTLYGAGNGSTTFNVPDLRGEFVRGFDAGRGVDAGRTFASAQGSENKAHIHRPLFDGGFFVSNSVEAQNISSNTNSDRGGGSQATGRRNLTIESTGGTESRPRNIALSYCIKT